MHTTQLLHPTHVLTMECILEDQAVTSNGNSDSLVSKSTDKNIHALLIIAHSAARLARKDRKGTKTASHRLRFKLNRLI